MPSQLLSSVLVAGNSLANKAHALVLTLSTISENTRDMFFAANVEYDRADRVLALVLTLSTISEHTVEMSFVVSVDNSLANKARALVLTRATISEHTVPDVPRNVN